MRSTDEALITEHLEGSADAFPELVERYLGEMYALALRRTGDSTEAEDIVQDVFLKAWKHLPRYRRESASFKTWLYRIASNTIIDFLRKRRGTAFSELAGEGAETRFEETLIDATPLADALLAQHEDAAAVRDAIGRLGTPAREIILMRYSQDLSIEEISAALGELPNTIKSRHRRAILALRKLLAKHRNA